MDSMRNLRGSLPGTNPRSRRVPPADLLQTFRQAALNVTNLYKDATAEIALERRAGYQDAIYELLALLDKENIGLGDGEGWRIRQWATEKQQLGPEPDAGGDEHESEGNEAEERDTSPVQEEEQDVISESSPTRDIGQGSILAVPKAAAAPATPEPPSVPTGDFTFEADVHYPEMEVETSSTRSDAHSVNRITAHKQNMTSRTNRRTSHANHRQSTRPGRSLGAGAGNKRKEHFGDLFGLGNMDNFKDFFAGHGPKRPRPT